MARAKKIAAAAEAPVHIPVQEESPAETPIMLRRSKYLVHVVGGVTVFAFSVLLGGMFFVSWFYGSTPNVGQAASPASSDYEY
jgi:hypothetical protein